MKAIKYTEYGPPEVLKLTELEKPIPKDNEILIKIHATTVNYGDLTARNFKNIPANKFNMPLPLMIPARIMFGFSKPKKGILGSEFAGEIEAVGKDVKRFKEGDKVFGYRGQAMGCYAEYLAMPEKGAVALKPENMTFEEAASIPYGALMAMNLLKKVKINSSSKVLVNGASGGIGSAAVQLLRHYGAEVTGVAGTPRLNFVKSLGADIVIDYKKEDFTKNGESYDIIFDVLNKSKFRNAKKALHETGIYFPVSFKTREMLQSFGMRFFNGRKVVFGLAAEKSEDLDTIRDLVEQGKMKTSIDKVFTLEQAAEAHEYVESGRKQGNVVITIN